jgi:hypothetical protein
MAYRLTYADREALLDSLNGLKAESNETDQQILEAIGQWAIQLQPSLGLELALTRDVTVLCRYLSSHKMDHDIVDIARGALLYALHSNRLRTKKIAEFGLLDEALICNYAVHEIRTRLGEREMYNPPRLTQAEQKRAEDFFVKFLGNPPFDNTSLIDKSQDIAQEFGNLAACGLFKRLQKNLDFLISVLGDSNRSREEKNYARAGLNYLVWEEDTIADHQGILGYLDDNFILQLAVDLIEPNREPWLELLDEIVGAWPFLNGLVIDDGSGGLAISEYMMINSGLTCSELHGKDVSPSILLIVPKTGPTTFLLGFISALGSIQQAGQQEVAEQSFYSGQKLLVDNCAIAEFTGFKFINGRKMFGLRQYHMQGGNLLPCIHYWPISDMDRLAPADSSRAIKGKLAYDISHRDIPLPALAYFLNRDRLTQMSGVKRRVIVVMPAAIAHEMAIGLSVYGQPMKDVVPMAHLSGDGEIRLWSNRFGQQEPLLVFVSDLDYACAFAEEDRDCNNQVIVENTARNAGKTASLRRLQGLNIPTLVVSTEVAADELSLIEDDDLGVWEWKDSDFSALLWPMQREGKSAGPLVRYERYLQSQSSFSPEIKIIQFPLAEQAFEEVRQVQALARKRGDERLAELDDTVKLVFALISHLLRASTPLTADTPSMKRIEAQLRELKAVLQRSRYFSVEEHEAVARTAESLQEFLALLQLNNPKAETLRELLLARPNLAIICPDARLRPDLEYAFSELGIRVLASYADESDLLEGAIIPGWFRKDRMAHLLVPPITKPLCMVLFEVEEKWYRGFCSERRKASVQRVSRSNRAKLFPRVGGWRRPKLELHDQSQLIHDSRLQELEEIHEHVRTAYRQRVYTGAQSDGTEIEVPASFVIFEGPFYGFLTESYRANVVTHLLEATVEDLETDADIKQKWTGQITKGDALLFHRGADSDVIRTAADKILAPGLRKTASIWQNALLNYVNSEGINFEELWRRLRNKGCPLKLQTIKIWLDNDSMISPQAYKRDLSVIAEVTHDETLQKHMQEVIAAIREVRSSHHRVSRQLAKQLLAHAVNILREEGRRSCLIQIESNVLVARVVDIDDKLSFVRASLTNRLLEDEQWHE